MTDQSRHARERSDYGLPEQTTSIAHVRGVEDPSLRNARLKWTSSGYAVTSESLTFYEGTGTTPKSLAAGEEATLIWRPAAKRWEELVGGAAAVVRLCSCDDDSIVLLARDDTGQLTANPGSIAVARLTGGSDADFACWKIGGAVADCAGGECVEVIRIVDNCGDCQGGMDTGGSEGPCFKLTNCDNALDFVTVSGLHWHRYVGSIVRLVGEAFCRTVEQSPRCDSVVSKIVQLEYSDCNACDSCYKLENCASDSDVMWAANDLAAYLGVANSAAAIGKVIQYEGECWEITEYDTCPGTEEILDLDESDCGLVDSFDGCDECPCYEFYPCAGNPESAYYARHAQEFDGGAKIDLSEYVGKIARTDKDGNGYCWEIRESTTCGSVMDPAITHKIYEIYDNCDCCVRYTLTECGTSNTITTYSDLCEQYTLGPVVIKRAEDDTCYEITNDTAAGDVASDVVVTVEEEYDNCSCCGSPRYEFSKGDCGQCDDCGSGGGTADGNATVVIDGAFEKDKWYKIGATCYQAVGCTTDSTTGESVSCGPFDSCEECAAAAVFIEVVTDVFIASDKLQFTKKKIKVLATCGEADSDVANLGGCPEPE